MIANAIASLFGNVRESLRFSQGFTSIGGVKTKSGQTVDQRSADTLSAVYCATRVIAEGLGQLPLDLRQVVDQRTTQTAYGHSVHRLMHDQPNPETSKFAFFDLQVPMQLLWGDCFAEKQFDLITNEVIALWPIHASRVEIKRGPYTDSFGNVLGKNKTLVYLVTANNGQVTAHEASEILHVPGVIDPATGYSGRSLVQVAAETLGIAKATQDHVAAFHRNGATPNLVVAYKNGIKPEDRPGLREQWSQKHGGTENSHKTIIVGSDVEVTPISISPKDALLIDEQRFTVTEVCRFWRVPPHMLYELGRATWANIEDQGQDFVTYTLGAWIARWEGALNLQLLTPAEQKTHFFKFNIKGLLRGNSTARIAYFRERFQMASLSINEIREYEDENPIHGGDRYFIASNNFTPLDRIDEAADAATGTSIIGAISTPATERTAADAVAIAGSDTQPTTHTTLQATAQQLLATALDGLIRYESHKAKMNGGKPNFDAWCEAFYAGPFRETFDKAVGPVLSGSRALGCTTSLEAFADAHVTQSKAELLALYAASLDGPMKAFEAKLADAISAWTSRAATEAATAFASIPTE